MKYVSTEKIKEIHGGMVPLVNYGRAWTQRNKSAEKREYAKMIAWFKKIFS